MRKESAPVLLKATDSLDAAWFSRMHAPLIQAALLSRLHGLEVDDYVRSKFHHLVFVAGDAHHGVAVEGLAIERMPIREFRADLDLRRKPVLPAQRGVGISRG